eukprot:13247638-Alexandrium_andersonii.AAC.1
MAASSKSGRATQQEAGEAESRAADRSSPPRGRSGAEALPFKSPCYCAAMASKDLKEGGETALVSRRAIGGGRKHRLRSLVPGPDHGRRRTAS